MPPNQDGPTDQGGATIAIILELLLGRGQVSVRLGKLHQCRYLAGNGVVLLLPIGGHTRDQPAATASACSASRKRFSLDQEWRLRRGLF
jgi:hypothetical protein